MNKEQIRKALECCKDSEKCDVCPYYGSINCQEILIKDAIDFINRQQTEIERLKAENEKRLTCDFVKTAQKKAVKEFAEKLKENYGKSCSEYYPMLIEMTSDDIDELLKEYEG